ncbi:MAG: hypothetical protein MUO76_14485 [Anaerolineaceae bacterium]|nr:hypothetical protein [Anaerolineaceae bacterium]
MRSKLRGNALFRNYNSTRTRSTIISSVLLLALIFQFYSLIYDPRDEIPSQADIEAGNEIVELIRTFDGDVLIPYQSYLAAMAGKTSYSQGMAMEDVFRGTNLEIRDEFKAEIALAIEQKEFDAIILDGEWRFMQTIRDNYVYTGTILKNDRFWPLTGMPTRSTDLYIKR